MKDTFFNLFLGAASLATGWLMGTFFFGQSEYRNDCQYKSKAHDYMQRLSDRIDGLDLEMSMIKALMGYRETLSLKQDSMVPEGLRLYDLSIG